MKTVEIPIARGKRSGLDKNAVENLETEVYVMCVLHGHPSIVTLHEVLVSPHSRKVHLVMELCEGRSTMRIERGRTRTRRFRHRSPSAPPPGTA